MVSAMPSFLRALVHHLPGSTIKRILSEVIADIRVQLLIRPSETPQAFAQSWSEVKTGSDCSLVNCDSRTIPFTPWEDSQARLFLPPPHRAPCHRVHVSLSHARSTSILRGIHVSFVPLTQFSQGHSCHRQSGSNTVPEANSNVLSLLSSSMSK